MSTVREVCCGVNGLCFFGKYRKGDGIWFDNSDEEKSIEKFEQFISGLPEMETSVPTGVEPEDEDAAAASAAQPDSKRSRLAGSTKE